MKPRSLVPLLLLGLLAAADPATPPAADLAAVRKAFRPRLAYRPSKFEMKVLSRREAGKDLIRESLAYPSPVRSVDPERNDLVRAVLYRRKKPEAAAVIALSGWRGEPATRMLARRLAAETGIQALLVTLPFQGERTPQGRRSGDLTLSADLDQTVAAFVQLAQDVGRAADWLVRARRVDPERLGILGTSLSGFAAATLYGLDDRFRSAVCLLAGADVADPIWNGNLLTAPLRQALEARGIDEAALRRKLAGISPGTWARASRKAGLLVVAAEEDRVVTLPNARKLAAAFGGADLLVMPGATHFSLFHILQAWPRMREHLRGRIGVPPSAGRKSGPPPAQGEKPGSRKPGGRDTR